MMRRKFLNAHSSLRIPDLIFTTQIFAIFAHRPAALAQQKAQFVDIRAAAVFLLTIDDRNVAVLDQLSSFFDANVSFFEFNLLANGVLKHFVGFCGHVNVRRLASVP